MVVILLEGRIYGIGRAVNVHTMQKGQVCVLLENAGKCGNPFSAIWQNLRYCIVISSVQQVGICNGFEMENRYVGAIVGYIEFMNSICVKLGLCLMSHRVVVAIKLIAPDQIIGVVYFF
jgi:hypothetical protein